MKTRYVLVWIVLLGTVVSLQAQTRKFKAKRGMVKLNPLRGNISLKPGQKVYYQAVIHASVGYTARVWSGDKAVLKLIDTHKAYKKRQLKGMKGGDKATKTFIFEAQEPGETVVYVKKMFRGKLQKEFMIAVVVKSD